MSGSAGNTTPTASITPRAKLLRSIILIVALLAVGTMIGWVLYSMRQEPPRRQIANLPRLVESLLIEAEDVEEHYIGYGSADAIRRANLAAEMAANVIERVGNIRSGSEVEKDQVLVRLDDRQYRHVLARAEALAEAEQAALDELEVDVENLGRLAQIAEQELRVARDERTRVTELLEQEQATKKEHDFANLAYQQARRVLQGYERELAKLAPRRTRLEASKRSYQASADLAGLDVERCEIKAPFAGRIQDLVVEVGDRVGPGSLVLTLLDRSRVEIPIQLPLSAYDRTRIGTACRVESESQPGVAWQGQVSRIAPHGDRQTRTFAAYVVVDNTAQGHPLVPGAFVRAVVNGPTHANRVLVPRSALRDGRVFIVEGGVARVRPVTTERFIEDRAMLSKGVRRGDRVILSHLDQLADGSPVRIDPALSAASDPETPLREGDMESSP